MAVGICFSLYMQCIRFCASVIEVTGNLLQAVDLHTVMESGWGTISHDRSLLIYIRPSPSPIIPSSHQELQIPSNAGLSFRPLSSPLPQLLISHNPLHIQTNR
jgi:hypothetical protein